MKQFSILFILSIFLFSCKKTETKVPAGSMSFNFSLVSSNPVTVFQGSSKSDLALAVKWTSGNAENIILTSSVLPDGVSFNPNLPKTYAASMFTLNTAKTIILPELIVATTATTGTYPITISATTSTGIIQTITFNLVISSLSDTMNFEFNLLGNDTIKLYTSTSNNDIKSAVKWIGGNAETITLTSGVLPVGVSFNPSLPKNYAASIFALNTATTIALPELVVATTAIAGTYPITITATTSSGNTKSFTFNLVVVKCVTQTENSTVGVYKGNWKILTINAFPDTLSVVNFLNIPDQKVYITSKTLAGLILTATVSGNNLTIANLTIPSLPIGIITLTNVTINGTGSFDCTGKIMSLTLNFVSGNIVIGGFPISIAGQSFSGDFTR